VSGEVTPDTAMDNLASEMDKVMARLERSGVQGDCGPKLNAEVDPKEWFAKSDGTTEPKPKLANEKPQGVTVDYDELIKRWQKK